MTCTKANETTAEQFSYILLNSLHASLLNFNGTLKTAAIHFHVKMVRFSTLTSVYYVLIHDLMEDIIIASGVKRDW